MNDNLVDPELPSSYAVMLPCEQKDFSEFISGLLGKPQTIEHRYMGQYEVTKDDLLVFHDLLEQRLMQQNDHSLIQFTARLLYSDDSSVRMNSLEEFIHYTEIKPLITVGIEMSWTYLIKFRQKNTPEKQRIDITFKTNSRSFIDNDIYYLGERNWSIVLLSINHTERTWGSDIESLITGHVKSILIKRHPLAAFITKYHGEIGFFTAILFLFGSMVGAYRTSKLFIESILLKSSQLQKNVMSDSLSDLNNKVNYILELVSSGTWELYAYKLLGYLILSFIMSFVFGMWISDKANNAPRSFVLLTKDTTSMMLKSKISYKKAWIMFIVSILVGIATGVVGNIIFTEYFADIKS